MSKKKAAAKKTGKKMGRPEKLTPELQEELLARISTGESIRRICSEDQFPAAVNVFKFIYRHDDFRQRYETARAACQDWHADGLLEIADEGSGDTQRDRLRVDARKWIMSKLQPKKYGDKLGLDHSGEMDINITLGGDAED